MRENRSTESIEERLKNLLPFLAEPQRLGLLSLHLSDPLILKGCKKINRVAHGCPTYGFGSHVHYLSSDAGEFYPVIDEFPILMRPERIVPEDNTDEVDLSLPQYREAYSEMDHYNAISNERALEKISDRRIRELMGGVTAGIRDNLTFPRPATTWVDARHDSVSQFKAYDWLGPVRGTAFLQLGGSGSHAIKALVAGARIAVLLTPMLGEARFAKSLARRFGVEDRMYCVIGVGEELPFIEGAFDRVYSGGCLHHMRTNMAFPQLARVLVPSGRFACVDPWKTLLHGIGTRLIGKRERGVFCRPIDSSRLQPLEKFFPRNHVSLHGPLLRYLFLAADKVNFRLSIKAMMRIMQFDNRVGRILGLNKSGGSIVICGEK